MNNMDKFGWVIVVIALTMLGAQLVRAFMKFVWL
jgi:hypothetical protein